jgi:hypothetical protein
MHVTVGRVYPARYCWSRNRTFSVIYPGDGFWYEVNEHGEPKRHVACGGLEFDMKATP